LNNRFNRSPAKDGGRQPVPAPGGIDFRNLAAQTSRDGAAVSANVQLQLRVLRVLRAQELMCTRVDDRLIQLLNSNPRKNMQVMRAAVVNPRFLKLRFFRQ
jgi:hypothetical protein